MKCSNCLQICFFHPRQNPALPIYTSSINVCHILFAIFLVLIIIFGRGSMLNEIQCSKLVLSNNYTDSISFTYLLKLTIGCIDFHSHQFVIIFYRPPYSRNCFFYGEYILSAIATAYFSFVYLLVSWTRVPSLTSNFSPMNHLSGRVY